MTKRKKDADPRQSRAGRWMILKEQRWAEEMTNSGPWMILQEALEEGIPPENIYIAGHYEFGKVIRPQPALESKPSPSLLERVRAVITYRIRQKSRRRILASIERESL